MFFIESTILDVISLGKEVVNLNRIPKNFNWKSQLLIDETKYNKLLEEGVVRFSRKAMLAGVFIKLFRNEPLMQQPNKILESLLDIDELFTTWRYRHAIMAHRLLGSKIGTGGSSGHDYLKMATENNRVYKDLFDLATFLVPKDHIPVLPEKWEDLMSFKIE